MSSIDQEVPQNTRLLKIIVVVLGILLVVGFIVVIATIIIRLGGLGDETAAEDIATNSTLAASPGNFDLPLAPGESIRSFTLAGPHMAIHVEGSDQTRMLIVDLNSGAVLRTFVVTTLEK